MVLGILILLSKQLRELGSILYSTLVTTVGLMLTCTSIKFCRPFTIHNSYQEIVSVLSNFPPWPINYKLVNPGYHGNSHNMENVAWKAQVIILSPYQKILSKRIRYSLLYQATIFILSTFYCCIIK